MKTLHASRFTQYALCSLVFVTALFARPLYVMAADANDCIVWSCDPNLIPYEIDVNDTWGRLLPPVPGDVNDWKVDCGKFQRSPAMACDPEGDSFSIAYVAGTSPATVYHDPNAGTWWFTAEVLAGANVWRFSAMDSPMYADPATSTWWVTCWGVKPANTAPILQ